MKSRNIPVMTIVASLAVLGGMALAAQDKYTCKCRMGSRSPSAGDTMTGRLSPSVSPKSPTTSSTVIVANPAMIDAYRAGVPGNGKPFPDGSKVVKILWTPKQHAEAPFAVKVPDTLAGVGCMVKDSSRFYGHRRMGIRPV